MFTDSLLYVPNTVPVTAIVTTLDGTLIYSTCLAPPGKEFENPRLLFLPALALYVGHDQKYMDVGCYCPLGHPRREKWSKTSWPHDTGVC